MGGFLEEAYPHADLETQAAFVRLLYCQDPDIYDWVMGAEEPKEPDLKMIISILQTKYGISPDR